MATSLRDLTARFWSAAMLIRRYPDPTTSRAARRLIAKLEANATGALLQRIAELKEPPDDRTD